MHSPMVKLVPFVNEECPRILDNVLGSVTHAVKNWAILTQPLFLKKLEPPLCSLGSPFSPPPPKKTPNVSPSSLKGIRGFPPHRKRYCIHTVSLTWIPLQRWARQARKGIEIRNIVRVEYRGKVHSRGNPTNGAVALWCVAWVTNVWERSLCHPLYFHFNGSLGRAET